LNCITRSALVTPFPLFALRSVLERSIWEPCDLIYRKKKKEKGLAENLKLKLGLSLFHIISLIAFSCPKSFVQRLTIHWNIIKNQEMVSMNAAWINLLCFQSMNYHTSFCLRK
jgi:hypothetical protein